MPEEQQHSRTPPRNHGKCNTWIHGDKCPNVGAGPGGDSVHIDVTDGCTVIQAPAPSSITDQDTCHCYHSGAECWPRAPPVQYSPNSGPSVQVEEHLLSLLYVVQEHNNNTGIHSHISSLQGTTSDHSLTRMVGPASVSSNDGGLIRHLTKVRGFTTGDVLKYGVWNNMGFNVKISAHLVIPHIITNATDLQFRYTESTRDRY